MEKTIEQLIEEAQLDIQDFQNVVAKYSSQNPEKYLTKKEELTKKLADKEQHLKDLQDIVDTNANQAEQQRQAAIQAEKAKEEAHKAEIEAARIAAVEQYKKEQAALSKQAK